MARIVQSMVLTCLLACMSAYAREAIDLSGEWQFRMDPQEVGQAEKWYADGIPFDRTIEVPGAWNAQGIGEPSDKLFHDFPGPGWYRRTVEIPAKWEGKTIRLRFGGVHRYADVWVNGQFVGSHIGYLTPFTFDITGAVGPGGKCSIVVRVDARQRKQVDPLTGCFDIIDAMFVTWGGLYRGVWLEATEQAWIEDVFVIPHIGQRKAEVQVETGRQDSTDPLVLAVEVVDKNGVRVGYAERLVAAGTQDVSLNVSIPNPRLWSPGNPYLYTAKVRLLQGSREVDSVKERFGMREFRAEGGQFLLNGKPIFLRGYGDDCVFPNTVAPPADKAEYYRRFKIAKDYGFNYVRHHSWFPLEEYFDVADELGIMLQPEFPIAYQSYYDAATPEGKKLYLEQWQEAIKAQRNHPSIVTWCMGNELYGGTDLSAEMYRTAKELDPTRLVIDSDGVGLPGNGQKSRATLDFLSVQFDEWGRFGFNDGKYDIRGIIEKPVVIHEMGNFGTLPDLRQADEFRGGIRPFWLDDARDLVSGRFLQNEYPEWVERSNQLQALALKTNIEAARRSHSISGYHQWLLQDYWTGSNGVLDIFYKPKGLSAEEFREFNSPTVLLMDCTRRNYRFGETAEVAILASRFEDEETDGATLRWEFRFGDLTVDSGTKTGLRVESGVSELIRPRLAIPTLPHAARLTLYVELTDENGARTNHWDFWAFPKTGLSAGESSISVLGLPEVRKRYADIVEDTSDPGLMIAGRLTTPMVDYLENGGRVFLLRPELVFKCIPSGFKPCWWLGDPRGDSNVGTVISGDHPAVKGFPNEGWCDLQFYPMIQGAQAVLLGDLPVSIDPIVRCLDVHTTLRDKAYLFEVTVGKGKLVVSGLNLEGALSAGDPAAGYLVDGLVSYALSDRFVPRDELPAGYLRSVQEEGQ